MNFSFLNKRIIRLPLTAIFLVAAILAIFPPDSFSARWWGNHAEWVVFMFLGLGMFFLMVNQYKLMMVALGCCGAVSFYLNETIKEKVTFDKPKDLPFIKLAHFNVTNSEGDADAFVNSVISSDADIVSIQEITYEWDSLLSARLSKHYPHSIVIPRFDPYGISLFSRYSFHRQDTFYFSDISNLSVEIVMPHSKDSVRVIASIFEPLLSGDSYENMRNHLEKISYEANSSDIPVICLGEFNVPGWSKELQNFRKATHMADSRMGMRIPQQAMIPVLDVPVDHIMFTERFECLYFSTIQNGVSDYLGIIGTYQLKKDSIEFQTTN